MTILTPIVASLFLALLRGCLCNSWIQEETPRCSRECAVTGLNKMSYTPSKTYIYAYTGASSVNMEGNQAIKTDMMWSAKIHLTFVTPCDIVLKIKEPQLMQHEESREWSEELSKYPLMVSVSEGIVQDVCAHPDDNNLSLNIKKGIISAFQNSLPSLSPINSWRTYNEVDITGECPTTYTIKSKHPYQIVTKFKDHKKCINPFENSLFDSLLLKKNIPLSASFSECSQEFQEGIISKVYCKERNKFKLLFGEEKIIEASQDTEMKFLTLEKMEPFNFTEAFKRISLMYDSVEPTKEKELVPIAREALRSLCRDVDGRVKEDAAGRIFKLIEILRHTPGKSIKEFLQEIRSGNICDDAERFEGIFLDVIGFVHQEGALQVMVEEMTNENSSELRSLFYAMSLLEYKHPTQKAVGALLQLLSSDLPPFYIKLFAGNIVYEYCKTNHNCRKEEELIDIFKVLRRTLDTACYASDAKNKYESLLALKIIGNMGTVDPDLEESIFTCASLSDEGSVRAAAMESFRRAPCSKKRNEKFKAYILDGSVNTELRTEAYLQFMRCPGVKLLKEILVQLRNDNNQEVLAFIASHLENIQASSAPYKQNLRNELSDIVVSEEFITHFKNYSRNINFDYFSKNLGIGAELDSNLIFDHDSSIPRKVSSNITFDILNNIINLEDFGIRMENFEPLWNFIRGNTHSITSINTMVLKMADILTRKNVLPPEIIRSAIQILLEDNEKHSEDINPSNDKVSKIDAYLRILGVETLFNSFSINMKNYSDEYLPLKLKEELEYIIKVINNSFFNKTRVFQIESDLFLPSSNGIPLRIKATSTSVIGLNFSSRSTRSSSVDKVSIVNEKLTPSISTESSLILQYNLGAKAGLESMVGLYSSDIVIDMTKNLNEVHAHLDVPGRAELLKVKAEASLMRQFPGKATEKIIPRDFEDPRIQDNTCSSILNDIIPFDLCWNYNVIDVFNSKIFPLGKASTLEIFIQSKFSSLTGIKALASWKPQEESNHWKLQLGSSSNLEDSGTEIEIIHGKNHFYIDLFEGSNEKIRRSLKIQLQSIISKYGMTNELSVYAGNKETTSSNDKVLHMSYGGKNEGQTRRFHYEFETMNAFEKYLNANIEIIGEIDTRDDDIFRPFGVSLPRFEIFFGSGQLEAETFLRKVTSGGKSEQFNFLSRVSQSNKNICQIAGHFGIKGSVIQKDFVLASNLKGKFGENSEYESSLDVIRNNKLSKYNFEVRDLARKLTALLFAFSHGTESSRSLHYKTKGQVEVADYTPKYIIEGDLTEIGHHQYMIDYTLYEDDQPRLEIVGPLTTTVSPEETKQHANFSISGFEGGNLNLELSFFQNQLNTKINFGVSRKNKMITNFKYNKKDNKDLVKVHSEFLLRNCIDLQLDGKTESEKVSLKFYGIFYPNTKFQRIVKGMGAIHKKEKYIESKIFYNVEERPNDNVHLYTHYAGCIENKKLSLKGRFGKETQDYLFSTGLQWGESKPGDETKRHILLDLTKPSKERFKLEALYLLDKYNDHKGDVSTLFEVITFSNSHFQMDSNICYNINFENFEKINVTGKIHLITPWFKEIVIEVETDSDNQEHSYELLSKVRVLSTNSSDEVKSLIALSFTKDNSGMENMAEAMLPRWIESKIYLSVDGTLESERIQSFAVSFNKNRNGDFNVHLGRDQTNIMNCRISQLDKGKWIINLEGPSKTIQAVSTISSFEEDFTLYPNREILANHWGKSSKGHGKSMTIVHKGNQHSEKDKYPLIISRDEDLSLLTSLIIKMTSIRGAIELISSENATDKIAISIERLQLADGSYEIETLFRSSSLQTIPRLLIHYSCSKSVKSITLKFKHESTSPPTVIVSGVIENFSSDITFYGTTKTPQNTFEVTGTIQNLENPVCYGKILNGSIYSASFGMYDISSAFCRPLFVSAAAGIHKENTTYVAKFGPKTISVSASIQELATNTVDKNTLIIPDANINSIFRAEAYLWKPSIISVESEYKSSDLGSFFKEKIRKGLDLSIAFVGTLLQDVIQEVFEKSFTPDENSIEKKIETIINEISDTVNKVFEDLRHEHFFPNFEDWKERITRKIKYVFEECSKMMDKIKTQLEEYCKSIFKLFFNFFEKINTLVKNSLSRLSKEIDVIMKKIADIFKGGFSFDNFWKLLNYTKIWHCIEDMWKKFAENFKKEVKIIENSFKEAIDFIKKEIAMVWKEIGFFSFIEKTIDWIKHWLSGDATTLLHRIFAFQFGEEEGFVRLKIPLKRPVYSIWAALRNVGMPEPTAFFNESSY